MTEFNYINCLKPLLQSLGWHGSTRTIFESVPHQVDEFDLIDLKNVFINLGYTCYGKRENLKHISRSFLPTLFISRGEKEIYVIYERSDAEFFAIDCRTGKKVTLSTRKSLTGYRYNFVKDPFTEASKDTWIIQVFKRFSKDLWRPLTMAFIIGLFSLLLPLFTWFVYDRIIPDFSQETLAYFAGGMGISVMCMLWLSHVKDEYLSYIGARLNVLINTEVMKKLLSLSPTKVEGTSVSSHLTKLKEYDSIRDLFCGPIVQIAFELPFVVLFLILITLFSGPIVLLPLITLILYSGAAYLAYPRIVDRSVKSKGATTAERNFLTESLLNLPSIKHMAGEKNWAERYKDLRAETDMETKRLDDFNVGFSNFGQTLLKLTVIGVLVWGTLRISKGLMTVGALMASLLLIWRSLTLMHSLFSMGTQFQQIRNTVRQINRLMTGQDESPISARGTVKPQGQIELTNVSFRYPNGTKPALQGITMDARVGETIAIVGKNGAGKSTLIKLLLGFHQPMAGLIRVDRKDLNHYDSVSYRQSIAYAPSTHNFFYGTIAQNLRLAAPEATDKDIIKALEMAWISNEIGRLPRGIHTPLNDHVHEEYSTGFLQKLSLARAYIKDSKIMIFDEPGSNIDLQSDELFRTRIKEMQGKKTLLLVTHRPSLINLADRVLVLSQGAMRLFGPRQQVLDIMAGKQS